jgi:hypothetical protein
MRKLFACLCFAVVILSSVSAITQQERPGALLAERLGDAIGGGLLSLAFLWLGLWLNKELKKPQEEEEPAREE